MDTGDDLAGTPAPSIPVPTVEDKKRSLSESARVDEPELKRREQDAAVNMDTNDRKRKAEDIPVAAIQRLERQRIQGQQLLSQLLGKDVQDLAVLIKTFVGTQAPSKSVAIDISDGKLGTSAGEILDLTRTRQAY